MMRPPEPKYRELRFVKLAAALVLEGATDGSGASCRTLRAHSLAEAYRALNAPEPPKRHRLRRVVLVAGAAGMVGAVAYVWQQRSADPVGS